MKVKRIVKPGQPGTKKLLERYGENLVCVRYRYDDENQRAYKTIELIIENLPWQSAPDKISLNKKVNLKIDFDETELRKQVKSAGGIWDPHQKVWQLVYKHVHALNLTNRIVD